MASALFSVLLPISRMFLSSYLLRQFLLILHGPGQMYFDLQPSLTFPVSMLPVCGHYSSHHLIQQLFTPACLDFPRLHIFEIETRCLLAQGPQSLTQWVLTTPVGMRLKNRFMDSSGNMAHSLKTVNKTLVWWVCTKAMVNIHGHSFFPSLKIYMLRKAAYQKYF